MSQSIKYIALLTLFLTANSTSFLLANEAPKALTPSQEELSSDKTDRCRKICLFQVSYRIAKRRETACAVEVVCDQEVQEANEGAVQDNLGSLTQDIAYESDVADQQAENKINSPVSHEAIQNDARTPTDDTDESDTDRAKEVFETPSEATDDVVSDVLVDDADNVWQDPLSEEAIGSDEEDDIAKQISEYEDEMDQDDSTFDGVVEQGEENIKDYSRDYEREEYYSTEEDYSSEQADTNEYDTDEYYTDGEVDHEGYDREQFGSEDSETQPEEAEGDLENQNFVDSIPDDEGTSDESTPEEPKDFQSEIQNEIDQNEPLLQQYPADEYSIEEVPYAVDEEDNPLEDIAYDADEADNVEGDALESDEVQSEESRSLPELSIDPNLVKLIANWQNLSPESQRKILEVVREDVQRVASDQTGLDD